jgi:hypothetical protein
VIIEKSEDFGRLLHYCKEVSADVPYAAVVVGVKLVTPTQPALFMPPLSTSIHTPNYGPLLISVIKFCCTYYCYKFADVMGASLS